VVIAQVVRALQYDRCARTNQFKCIKCLGIPGEVYDALFDCKELNWFCCGCSEVISKCNTEKEDKVIGLLDKVLDRRCGLEDRLCKKVLCESI